MNTIEDIVLRYSERGMKDIRPYVSTDCCHKAAKEILSWERGNVFLTTGFYVAGYAETDGPVGTLTLALALKKLGFSPIMLTDSYCEGFFEEQPIGVEYVSMDADKKELDELVAKYQPVGMISVDRCGKNDEGLYANMRGVDISPHTAPIDELFVSYGNRIPSIGVGDGGNEIGMGKIAGPIRRKLSLNPCVVSTDVLVIASVSNWGAYGIVAALGSITDKKLLPEFSWIEDYIAYTVKKGSVDGISHENIVSVDGKDMTIECEIITALHMAETQS